MKDFLKKNFGVILAVFYMSLFYIVDVRLGIYCTLIIFLHEFGHYVVAKHYGVYLGYEINMMPTIKMSRPTPIWTYSMGFLFSLIMIPLSPFFFPSVILRLEFVLWSAFVLLMISIFDIIIMIQLLRKRGYEIVPLVG